MQSSTVTLFKNISRAARWCLQRPAGPWDSHGVTSQATPGHQWAHGYSLEHRVGTGLASCSPPPRSTAHMHSGCNGDKHTVTAEQPRAQNKNKVHKKTALVCKTTGGLARFPCEWPQPLLAHRRLCWTLGMGDAKCDCPVTDSRPPLCPPSALTKGTRNKGLGRVMPQ